MNYELPSHLIALVAGIGSEFLVAIAFVAFVAGILGIAIDAW